MKERPYIVFGSPLLGEPEIESVVKTISSAWIGTGPRVHEFEERLSKYTQAPHAIAVGSCTAALHLSLVVSGVGAGDEVITTPMTFAATAAAIVHAGATPVFVDCERDTMNIDPDAVRRAVTPKTRAILPVHFAGRPCKMDELGAIAKEHNLLVIEDAAHALEAEYKGKKIGSISPLTCFSFYVTKNITTAEGGLVTSQDKELAEKIKIYGLHGMTADAWSRFSDSGYKHYEVVFPGYKYNMTDLQASLGLVQLDRMADMLVERNRLWAKYDKAFADLPVFLPAPQEEDTVHARHLYTLLLDLDKIDLSRDEFMIKLHKMGIGTGVHYRALHLHQYYRERFGFSPEDFPNAAWISDRTVSLPLSAKVTESESDYIIDSVRSLIG